MPLFEGLNGRLMLQGALRNVAVVYLAVVRSVDSSSAADPIRTVSD